MNIIIRNYLAGSFLLEQEPNVWDAIVILDSGLTHTDFVGQYARKHMYLQFDDVSNATKSKKMPTFGELQAALEFATESDKDLMVCCRAGQSRSAAVAFVIACQRLGPESACRLLDAKRHIPNPFIVDIGAKLLGDSSVSSAFAQWRVANEHVKLSDYVDEIEREFDQLELQGARNRIVRP